MRTTRLLLLYVFPAVGWMAVIFILSSRQRVSVSEEYVVNFIAFKTLHIIEYAFLFFLYFRLLFAYSENTKPTIYQYVFAALFALLFAATDELHQTFVPTRQGTVRDVLIDLAGISSAVYVFKKYFKKLRSFTLI